MFLLHKCIMENGKYVDLHSHTIYSDGSDTPETLLRAVALKGTDVFALTDHDTMAGYIEAKKEADKWGVRLISGVEVSTSKYHILGLNVNPDDEGFQKFLLYSQEIQKDVCRKRIEKIATSGVPITLDKLLKTFPKSRVGKYNILMTMLLDEECRDYLAERHSGKSPDEIFGFYLRSNGIAGKVNKDEVIHSAEAIEQIHLAGGIAIIAHPFKEVTDIENELGKLRRKGIDGLEIQPNYGEKNIPFLEYADKNGMKITYGSDFHGPAFPRKLLGREYSNLLNIVELLRR